MATEPTVNIRGVLLETINEIIRSGGSPQTHSVLQAVRQKINVPHHGHPIELAILTQWNELFRTGLLAWGMNLSNPEPPFCHVTESGKRALANASRDPSNPEGYLQHLLAQKVALSRVTRSYLTEGLDCYVAGFFKAAAVMVGAAAESMLLELRDLVVSKFEVDLKRTIPKDLKDWKISVIARGLDRMFDAGIDKKTHQKLRDRYDNYWQAFVGQIRTARNDAGHPASIEPVTPDIVHASLLIFPEMAVLANALENWVVDDMK
jgi:hypothetical protein